MFKKVIFAMCPLALLVSTVSADDNLSLDISSITDASVEIQEASLDIDVDQLAADAGETSEDQAIEACFRGYGYRGYGYRSYGYRGYGYGGYGYNCYRPSYRTYYTYRTVHCYRPVYRCAPVYYHNYWGCH